MGFLDKFFAWGAKKTIAQAYHTGVSHNQRHSNGSKYPLGTSSAAPVTNLDHYSARAQARQKYQDSPAAKGVINRFVDSMVDIGLFLDPTPVASIIGISEEEAEAKATEIKARFELWAKSKTSTRSETLNFYQSQKLAAKSWKRDGEYFIRFIYSKRKDLLNPLQLAFIDPQQIRGDALTSSVWPLAQDDGIVRDEGGRAIAYKISIQDKSKPYRFKNVEVPAKSNRSGRTMMIHGFEPDYAGQGRGYTKMIHALQEFELLVNYELAELNKAGNAATVWGYTKPSDKAPGSNPFEDTLQMTTDPSAITSVPVNETSGQIQYNPLKEATITNPGAMYIANLHPGEDIVFPKSVVDGENFSVFRDSAMEYAAASMEMPIEVLKMKFGQNYSASRATLILFWRLLEIGREEMSSDFLNPVYESWLAEEIAAGRISLPGWIDPIKKAAWLNCTWIGAPMPNIDPVKTAMANKHNMEMDATNPDRVARELNRSDARVNKIKNNRHFEGYEPRPWMASYLMEEEEDG